MHQAFRNISERAEHLSATLQDILRWAVTEGVPQGGDHVLVGRYEEATNDLLGVLHELRSNAGAGGHSVPHDFARARHALIECQERASLVARRFYWELYSPEAVEALHMLQSEGRHEWRSWTTGVKDALARCRTPIEELNQSLVQAWLELTERPGLVAHPAVCCTSGRSGNPGPESERSSK